MTFLEAHPSRVDLAPLEVLRRFRSHDLSLVDFLQSRVECDPAKPFLLFEEQEWSYEEFARDSARYAKWLAARGVGAGDRIGVLSHNHPSTALLFFALARLGATLVPANPEYGAEEAAYVFGHAQVKGLIVAPPLLPVAKDAVSRLSAQPWLVLNEPADEADISILTSELMNVDDACPPRRSDDLRGAICTFIYTSGTTGFPKAVMHGQEGVVLTGESFVGRMNLQPDDRLLCVLPLFHANALFYSLCGAIACGGSISLVRRFSASRFWQIAATTAATEVNMTAALARILMLRPAAEFDPESRLRKAFIAPLSEDIFEAFTNRFGLTDLIECYGMSEIPGVIGNPFAGERRIGTMGLITAHPDPAVPRPEARIVDENFRDVADGEIGQLVVRTPTIMKGYYNAPEQTEAAFHNGWFLTGDLVHRDNDGYFRFKARQNDIIRRRGENISGAEIDRVVCAHPAVAEAATIGVDSKFGEEDILVAVVPVDGSQISAHEIASWVATRLAHFKVPRFVAFVSALPQTATHRVEKYKLRNDPALVATATDLESE